MSYLGPRTAVGCWTLIKYTRNFIQHSTVFTSSAEKLLVIIIVDSDVTGQLLITYSTFVKYLKKK